MLAGALVLLALTQGSGAAHPAPQGPATPSADTLADLRAAVHAHPDSVELLMALGRALTDRSSEVESNFTDRMEARGYLDHAVRLRSNDPRTWLEYGLLVRKQHYGVDAMRALKHAEQLAAHADSTFTTADRADLHEGMGRLYEMYGDGNARRQFEMALDLAPDRLSAATALLALLAKTRQWPAYMERAQTLARNRPNDAEAWLFLGMGYHETGQGGLADSAYRLALALASPDLRTSLLDISGMVVRGDSARVVALSLENHAAEDDVYWAMRDPLFLTPENERLAEHFSRVAYADMAFSDPWSGTIGRNSDLGRVWIWYGRSGPAYRRFDPRLVFVRANRMYNYARLSEQSEFLLNQLRKEVPERYQPTHPRIVASLLFQVARFHGTERKTELVVYGGRIPDDALGKTDSIRTGLFVFALNPWNAAASERSTVSSNTPVRPHFAAQLDPGRYMVSLEALGNDRAATGRDTIVIAPRGAGLELSDLLLADRIMPRAATPRSRDDLAIEGSATLTFRARSPVGVVWELYGLATDSVNIARYHVQLEVRDTRGGLIRALRTLTLQGNARETNLAWDAERALEPNEAALEFTTLALIDPRPGSYRLLISVTDRITGAHASAERQFTVVP